MPLQRPLPAEQYVDPAVYAAEQRDVFGREWLVACALAALPDGHATVLTVAGLPVWDGETVPCPRFRCRYYGWQYDSEGRLIRAPHFGADPPDTRLHPVHTAVFRGLVFASFADDPVTLQPRLDALAEGAGSLDCNVYRGGLSLERIVPVGPDTPVIDYTFLFAPDATAAEREAAMRRSETVTDEDKRICEAVQANLASGRYTPGWLSPRHEAGVGAFQAWVRAATRVVEAR